MVDSWNITIPELTGDEPRRAYVYLPDSWEMDPDLRYPVLYMFDGHNVFFDEDATYGKSWGMSEYLDATQTQIMVVAVECNHHPDNGRLGVFPLDVLRRRPRPGGGAGEDHHGVAGPHVQA